jgi:uncharacterized protein YndB with AHSA1/START domain
VLEEQRRMVMAHIEKSVLIEAPVEKVFAYASDLAHITEWFPLEVRGSTHQRVERGAKLDWSYRMMGIRFDGTSEYVDVVPNQRINVKNTGGIPSTFDYRYANEGGKTRITAVVDYEIPGKLLGKIADRLVVERVNANAAENVLANLKAICEASK